MATKSPPKAPAKAKRKPAPRRSPDAIEACTSTIEENITLYVRSEVRVHTGGRTKRWRIPRRDWHAIRRLIHHMNLVSAAFEGEPIPRRRR